MREQIKKKTPKEIERGGQEYLHLFDKLSKKVLPTVDGLAKHLGMNKSELLALKSKSEEYECVIDRALHGIEMILERLLHYEDGVLDVMEVLIDDFGWVPLSKEEKTLCGLI